MLTKYLYYCTSNHKGFFESAFCESKHWRIVWLGILYQEKYPVKWKNCKLIFCKILGVENREERGSDNDSREGGGAKLLSINQDQHSGSSHQDNNPPTNPSLSSAPLKHYSLIPFHGCNLD